MSTPEIPFLDLVTVHRELRDELCSVFETALDTAGFIGGPVVREFERDFAEFCEAPFCVGMASGTDALRFALIAAGVRAGDTVVTVPLTFIATTEAISQAGARADFVDIDERTYTMDPEALRTYLETGCTPDPITGRLVSHRTGGPVTAVVPVHLYGQIADMDPILELAARYDLMVIEDACQAHGAEYFSTKEGRWRKAGSMGRVAACMDNAAMESFFSLLQKNVFNSQTWRTRDELHLAIVTWIERTYHRRRRQRTLGKLTPIEFETIYAVPEVA